MATAGSCEPVLFPARPALARIANKNLHATNEKLMKLLISS
jgi:hypothetical protein